MKIVEAGTCQKPGDMMIDYLLCECKAHIRIGYMDTAGRLASYLARYVFLVHPELREE